MPLVSIKALAKRLPDEPTPASAGIRKQVFADFIKVEAAGASTVRFTTGKPEPRFETLLDTPAGSAVLERSIMGCPAIRKPSRPPTSTPPL